MQEYFEANRRSWDERVAIHAEDETGFYSVAKVLRGEDKLNAIEAREIGDIAGLRIAHLQCHFGLDSFCLERRGAEVVGLDFSTPAIAQAREWAKTMGLKTRFVEGNVYDARRLLDGEFDMVYVTWGAIGWLPDIRRWAKVVSALLKPGGRLYLLEGHPSLMTLDEKTAELRPAYDWRTPEDRPLVMDEETTYTGDTAKLAHTTTMEWLHPLSDVVNAAIGAGLRIDALNEHELLAWQFAPLMVPVEGRRRMWKLPDGFPRLPLAYSLMATKS